MERFVEEFVEVVDDVVRIHYGASPLVVEADVVEVVAGLTMEFLEGCRLRVVLPVRGLRGVRLGLGVIRVGRLRR